MKKQRLIDDAYWQESPNRSIMPLSTVSPEFKPAIRFEDDLKPVFRVGEYVRVARDFYPGKNRQEGYGFVEEVAVCGAATLVSVRTNASGDGRLHKAIPMNDITPAEYYMECLSERPKRKSREVDTLDTSPPKKKHLKEEDRLLNC